MGHPVTDQGVVHRLVEVLPVVGDGRRQHPLVHLQDPAQLHELIEDRGRPGGHRPALRERMVEQLTALTTRYIGR
jgi:hypothetical protein